MSGHGTTLHGAWVDEGQWLDAAKLRTHGITAPYFSHREATKDTLQAAADQGFAPGIYSAWNWYPTLGGQDYAFFLVGELTRIAGVATATPTARYGLDVRGLPGRAILTRQRRGAGLAQCALRPAVLPWRYERG